MSAPPSDPQPGASWAPHPTPSPPAGAPVAGWPTNTSYAAGTHPGYQPQQWRADPSVRYAAAVTVARILVVPLVALGLSIPFTSDSAWVTNTTWSVFAMAAAFVQLAPLFAGRPSGVPSANAERMWFIGAIGTGGLLLHWVLLALPSVASDAGFCLTVATAAAAVASWFTPGRRL